MKKYAIDQLMNVVLAPVVSEKGTFVADKFRQYVFRVADAATKPEIKAAVELMFAAQKVEVASVQIVNVKGTTKRFGRSIGRRDHVKKAYVSLKEGQQLNFSGEAA
jgi:large subunit ribosomal protein L23